MNVYGKLVKAQLEQIAASTATPAALARIYADTTNPIAAVPMFYDGTSWKPVQLGQTDAVISQNSAKSVTVNWALGLNQEVVLTDNAVISFQNPVAGKRHTLTVRQANPTFSAGSYIPFLYALDMADQAVLRTPYQPVRAIPYGNSRVHTWLYSPNIDLGYATVPSVTSSPFVAPATASTFLGISPDNRTIFTNRSTTPFTENYMFDASSANPTQNPWRAKNLWGAPTATVAAPTSVAYSPNGEAVFMANATTPFIQGIPINTDNGPTGTSFFANPGTLPTGAGRAIDVHPLGTFVAVGHTTTPFLSVYPFTGAAYGTKLTNPSPLPSAQVNAVAFSPLGDYLAIASQTTPFIQVYAFDPVAGAIGAQVANPSNLPTGGPTSSSGRGVAWRPQGDYIAICMSTNPYLFVYEFNRTTGAFGSLVASAPGSTGPVGETWGAKWSPCGNYLVVNGVSPGIYIYDFSAFTLNGPVVFDGGTPGAQINAIELSLDGEILFSAPNSVTLTLYTMPRKPKNYLKLVD